MKTEYHYVVDKDGNPLLWRETQGKSYWSSGREGEVPGYTNPDLLVILNNLAELSELDAPRNANGQWLQAESVVDWGNLVMQELKVRMKFTLSRNAQTKGEGDRTLGPALSSRVWRPGDGTRGFNRLR